MRRLEYLITEVRNSTDNTDTSAVKDAEIIAYFNAGQKLIQSIVMSANSESDMFKAQTTITLVDGTFEYDLPSDIWSENAISMVELRVSDSTVNDGYSPLRRMDETELGNFFGYVIRNNQIIISGTENFGSFQEMRVTYFRQLKKIDKRWAKVTSVTPGAPNEINLTGGDTNLSTVDDYFSVVDKDGTAIKSALYVSDDYASYPTKLKTNDTVTGIAAGHYIVSGKNSTTHCELPESCETYLLDYVRQRIFTRNNYSDAGKQKFFTDLQQADIINIFAKKSKDISTIPIVDYSFLEY